MTPQERHYARLGKPEPQIKPQRREEASAYDWRFIAAACATILIGIVAGEISTAWIADRAEQAVQRQ